MFVLYVKNVKDSCSSLCVPTLLPGMDDEQRRGRSRSSTAIAAFIPADLPMPALRSRLLP